MCGTPGCACVYGLGRPCCAVLQRPDDTSPSPNALQVVKVVKSRAAGRREGAGRAAGPVPAPRRGAVGGPHDRAGQPAVRLPRARAPQGPLPLPHCTHCCRQWSWSSPLSYLGTYCDERSLAACWQKHWGCKAPPHSPAGSKGLTRVRHALEYVYDLAGGRASCLWSAMAQPRVPLQGWTFNGETGECTNIPQVRSSALKVRRRHMQPCSSAQICCLKPVAI